MLTTRNMTVHNIWAEQLIKAIKPYLSRIAGEPGTSLVAVRSEGGVENAYVLIGSITSFPASSHQGKTVALAPDARLGFLFTLRGENEWGAGCDWHIYCVDTEEIMGYLDTTGTLPA